MDEMAEENDKKKKDDLKLKIKKKKIDVDSWGLFWGWGSWDAAAAFMYYGISPVATPTRWG